MKNSATFSQNRESFFVRRSAGFRNPRIMRAKSRYPPFSERAVRATMSLQEEFDLAVEVANKLPKASNEDMLELYGWFKQVNVGDVNTGASVPREPSLFRRVRIAPPR